MLLCAMFDDFVALSLPRVAPSSDVSSNVRESRTAGPFLALLAGWRVCVDGPPLAACRRRLMLVEEADWRGINASLCPAPGQPAFTSLRWDWKESRDPLLIEEKNPEVRLARAPGDKLDMFSQERRVVCVCAHARMH